jgi:predicted  nucleic acid-binding Zn-ribbon protein
MRNIDTITREQLILLVERLDQENWTLRNKVKCLESDIRELRNKTKTTSYKTYEHNYAETSRKFRIDDFGNAIPEPLNNII